MNWYKITKIAQLPSDWNKNIYSAMYHTLKAFQSKYPLDENNSEDSFQIYRLTDEEVIRYHLEHIEKQGVGFVEPGKDFPEVLLRYNGINFEVQIQVVPNHYIDGKVVNLENGKSETILADSPREFWNHVDDAIIDLSDDDDGDEYEDLPPTLPSEEKEPSLVGV